MHGDADEDRRCQIYSLNPKSCMMRTVISAKEAGKRNNSNNTKSYVLVIVLITPTTNTVTLMLV